MGIISSFLGARKPGLTPDSALEILYEALIRVRAEKPTGTGTAVASGADSFAAWCRRLGLPRYKLDRYIRKELGCSGQEWMDAVRNS